MDLLEALKRIRWCLDNAVELPFPTFGICSNCSYLVYGFITRMSQLENRFKSWPKCKNSHYPIEGDSAAYHRSELTRWDKSTTHGALRHELLDFLITELEKE